MTLGKYIFKMITKFIIVIITIMLFLLIPSFTNIKALSVTEYSDVLDDLKQDSNFNENDYPNLTYEEITELNSNHLTEDDVKLASVLHVAESDLGNLIIYVYKPTNSTLKFDIKYINMSVDNGESHNLYNLKLLDSSSVFDKYLVEDFKISDSIYRYYKITSIYRNYINESIDGELNPDFEKSGIAIECGQNWKVYWLNDELIYEMKQEKYVLVESVYTDNVRMQNGIKISSLFFAESCDAWYYCFNIKNYKVDEIYDADLTFDRIDKSFAHYSGADEDKGDLTIIKEYDRQSIFLSNTDEMTFTSDGWLGKNFNWNRIMESSEFVSSLKEQGASFDSSTEKQILSSQYTFSFLETNYKEEQYWGAGSFDYTRWYSDINNVSLLRLKFISDGKTYNLGVVSDLISPDDTPGINGDLDISEWFEIIMQLIALLILLILLGYLTPIFKTIWNVFVKVSKIILKVILIPFELIGQLFKPKKPNNKK